jgi:O-antigen/teichoic acid export membrane protein
MAEIPETSPRPARADVFRLIGLGVGVRLLGTAVGVLLGVATIALAVRLLGTSTYGVLAFATSVMVLVAGLCRLGLEAGITRSVTMLSIARDSSSLVRLARGAVKLVFLTGIAGFLAIVIAMLAASLGTDTSTELALGIALGVALFAANTTAVASSFARGLGRMALMEGSNLVQTMGRFIVIAILAGLGLASLDAVALGYGVVALASITVSIWLVRRLVGGLGVTAPARAEARTVLAVSAPFAVTGLAVVVISRFDVLVLGLTGSGEELGSYEPTLKIVEQVMLLVPLLFMAPFLPAATRLMAASDRGGFRELFVAVSKLVYVISAPAVILFVGFPEAVLHGLYGRDFPADGLIVWILLGGFVVNLVLGLNGSSLAAVGNRRALIRVGAVGTASMVVLAATLVPPFGPTGAAVATSATYVVINVVAGLELLRVEDVHPFGRDFLAVLLTSVVPVLGALAIRRWAGPVDLWTSIGWSLGLWAAWLGWLFWLGAIRPHELKRLVPASRGG